MAEITSAKEAIGLAQNFIEPHYPWHRPVKAIRQDGVWIVEFDVGAVDVEIASMKIDAITGEITEFVKATPA